MRGFLLVNVGTPADCTKKDIKDFIGAMLSDPYLSGMPAWLSKILANNIIAPMSCIKSSKKYNLIWRKQEPIISPIIYYMEKLAKMLHDKKDVPVEIGMRYGNPSIEDALNRLNNSSAALEEVIIFPLFPHYAQSTTKTVSEAVKNAYNNGKYPFKIRIVEPYYDHPAYINALAENAKPYIFKGMEKLVFNYHSLPIYQVEAGWKMGHEYDYVYQLKETNRLLCEKLELKTQQSILFYGSQRGKAWLSPFLDQDISDMPRMGWKKISIIAPGFPIDNLETLYDINTQARELFMEAGGEKFVFIPGLNDNECWVEAIWKISVGI